MSVNNELKAAWEFVEKTGRSVFLTGKAGTGKTTFLREVVASSSKRVVVVFRLHIGCMDKNCC